MFYEDYQLPLTLIGNTKIIDTDFALKSDICEHRQSFAKPSFIATTEISSGSSNWAVLESIGEFELVDVNIDDRRSDFITSLSNVWIEGDKSGFVSYIEGVTQAVKESKQISVLGLIEEIRKDKGISYSEQIANQLYQLNDDVLDDYPDNDLISSESLIDFGQFLKKNSRLSLPSITINPRGNIMIQWEPTANQHFSIEFTGQGEVIFVVFAPDLTVPSKVNRVSGKSTIYSLMSHVQSYNVDNWISIKEKAA